jgi:hypothetical protein
MQTIHLSAETVDFEIGRGIVRLLVDEQMYLSPGDCRRFAKALISAADEAEAQS